MQKAEPLHSATFCTGLFAKLTDSTGRGGRNCPEYACGSIEIVNPADKVPDWSNAASKNPDVEKAPRLPGADEHGGLVYFAFMRLGEYKSKHHVRPIPAC